MADQGIWFKLWIGADEEPVLGDFSLADFGRWCKFGLYLKKFGSAGKIELKSPCRPLQNKFEVTSFNDVLNVLRTFPNCAVESDVSDETVAIVTWRNWLKYQGDKSTERVRRFRARETPKKRREEMRRDEKRIDHKNDLFPFEQKRKTKTAYPDDFSIADELRTWAIKQHCPDPDAQLEAFRDYHIAHGSRFIDWDAAFRSWIRNSFKFGPRPVGRDDKLAALYAKPGRTTEEIYAERQALRRAGKL